MSKKEKRHPFRSMLKLLVLAGLIGFVASTVKKKKLEWTGLTESEAREKFKARMGPRIGEDRAAEIADEVIPKMKDRGLLAKDE